MHLLDRCKHSLVMSQHFLIMVFIWNIDEKKLFYFLIKKLRILHRCILLFLLVRQLHRPSRTTFYRRQVDDRRKRLTFLRRQDLKPTNSFPQTIQLNLQRRLLKTQTNRSCRLSSKWQFWKRQPIQESRPIWLSERLMKTGQLKRQTSFTFYWATQRLNNK